MAQQETSNGEQDAPGRPGEEFGFGEEEQDGLFGWSFHKGPVIAALALTLLLYILVFLWVD